MFSKKLNNNKTICASIILAISVIVTLIALTMAFTKPAIAETGEDSARECKSLQTSGDAILATSDYKSIQKTFIVEEKSGAKTTYTVNFLPAVTDASWAEAGLNFYKKNNDGTYTELSQATNTAITSMHTLAKAIENIDPSKTAGENAASVYTDASGVTFYGTIDRSWNRTFKSDTVNGISEGLNPKFAESLTKAGLETVYFDGNTSTTALSDWNWDSSRRVKCSPILNGVTYSGITTTDTSEFFGAYRTLLSSKAFYPWACRALGENLGSVWLVRNFYWYYDNRNIPYAVVLSQDF